MWKAYLADVGTLEEPEVYGRLYDALTEQKAAQVAKLKNRKDRLLSVGAEALLSMALSRYLAGTLFEKAAERVTTVDLSAIDTVTFVPASGRISGQEKGGKPFLVNYPDFHYNLSHSGTKVLLAVSDAGIGCDIQQVTGWRERVAKRCFTETELVYCLDGTEDERAERFTEVWARKESFVKAIGLGIAANLTAFSVCERDGKAALRQSLTEEDWELIPADVPEGYRGSICVRKERRRVERVKKKEKKLNPEKIRKYVDSLAKKYGLPTADCMIMKDHQVLFRHMYGAEDPGGTPVSGLSRYLVFSMTKIVPAKRPMLVWHLLSMQSGLDYDLNRPGIRLAIKKYGQKATTRQIVDSFPETPLGFHPGERFLYSLSHDVAAAIVEVVSGMTFSEYLRKNLWKPLGMKHTAFFKRHDARKHLVQQYVFENEKIVPMENDCSYRLSDAYESGGAGLVSTTEDYAILADTLACGGTAANGAQILKPETF